MTTILVVDDEPDLESLIRQRFRREIRQKKYDFFFAENGVKALEVLRSQPQTDLVLTDINMPQMDGLTLLSKLHELNPILKAVIVSAYGDMENIRTAMNRGAFDFVTKPINFEDLSITVEKTLAHINQLKETLEAIKQNNILKMYVDESVLQFMDTPSYEENLMANEMVEATVLFIDVCGFTSISETSAPDTVVRLINSYFEVMVKEILDHNGLVDKFIGDAVMAVFRGDYHLDRAVEAALAVRQHIGSLQASEIGFTPAVSIGIKSGEMISGNIGSASLRRLDYTVIGDTVNTAARLQDAAKPNQILICDTCHDQIHSSFECKSVGEIVVKNKTAPLRIYEVIS